VKPYRHKAFSFTADGRGRNKPPGPEQMDALLRRCGIHLAPSQLNQLWAYHRLLRRHDAELNLTRIRNFDNMVLKLYADSILPALHAPLPSPLLDLGTGPGMPGIPLKIFRPDLHILLAESRQSRTDFLKTAVSAPGTFPGLMWSTAALPRTTTSRWPA
jgi:16S rRNA G527 N7-methylase RsmG